MPEEPGRREIRGLLRLEALLELDAENAEETLRLFREVDPGLVELFDEAASLYFTISRAFSQGASDDAAQRIVDECAATLGTDGWDELWPFLQGDERAAPEHEELVAAARRAWDESYSSRVRALLISIAYRAYMWAATDLLRLRATPALGYARIQAEAIGLAALFVSDASLANRWFEIFDDNAGRDFYRDTQQRVRETLARLGLEDAYDMGSGVAQHVRASGIAESFSQTSFIEREQRVHQMSVSFQEVMPGREFAFFLRVSWLLRLQAVIFEAIVREMPEVTDPLLSGDRLPGFRARLDRLAAAVDRHFPEDAARLNERQRVREEE